MIVISLSTILPSTPSTVNIVMFFELGDIVLLTRIFKGAKVVVMPSCVTTVIGIWYNP